MATSAIEREDPLTEKKGSPKTASWTPRFLYQDTGGAVRRDIQGLRAIAVLLVMLFHANVRIPGGLVGVDVFFVISGFIITGALVKELETTGALSIRGFYARRAKRLLPATAVVLIATLLLTIAFIPKTRWVGIGQDLVASTLYVQNWRLAALSTDYQAQNAAPSPLQHFWSLGVEEQFYLLWPALLIAVTLIPRRGLRRHRTTRVAEATYATWLLCGMLLVLLPSLAWSIYYTQANPDKAYFVTTTRLWELAIGGTIAVVAHWLLRTPRLLALILAWLGLGLTIWSAWVITQATLFPGYAALLPVLGTAAVIGFAPAAGTWGPALLLSLRPLVWIGGLSYSLYLWHWLLIVTAEARWGLLTWEQGLIAIGVAFVAAYLSLRFVENPVRFSPMLGVERNLALKVGAVCMAAGIACALALELAAWPPPPPVPTQSIDLGMTEKKHTLTAAEQRLAVRGSNVLRLVHPKGDVAGAPKNTSSAIYPDPAGAASDVMDPECVARSTVKIAQPCLYGDPDGKTTVALVGDSHAHQWLPPIAAIADARNWRLEFYAQQNCIFATGVVADMTGVPGGEGRPYKNCASWVKSTMKQLIATKPSMVIISAQEHGIYVNGHHTAGKAPAALTTAFENTFGTLQKKANTLVVTLADTPRPAIDVPACVSQNIDKLTNCAFPSVKVGGGLQNNRSLDVASSATPGVKHLDLSYAICPTKNCAAVIGNVLVYRDTNHLTQTYAGTLAPRLNRLLPKKFPK